MPQALLIAPTEWAIGVPVHPTPGEFGQEPPEPFAARFPDARLALRLPRVLRRGGQPRERRACAPVATLPPPNNLMHRQPRRRGAHTPETHQRPPLLHGPLLVIANQAGRGISPGLNLALDERPPRALP